MKSNLQLIMSCIVLGLCMTRVEGGRGNRPTPKQAKIFVEELGPMSIMPDQITISGWSSGGSIAQILQVAYSKLIRACGVFSHTFMRCGPPDGIGTDFDNYCTRTTNTSVSQYYNPELVHKDIADYFARGIIDDPKNLKNKRLYVYTGLRSKIFTTDQGLNVLKVFERYIQNPHKIKTVVQDSVFVMPTDNYGRPCTEDAADKNYIGNCGFSGAHDILRFLYADNFDIIHPKESKKPVEVQPLRYFSQKPFLRGLDAHQMDDIGFFYVPKHCQHGNPCPLHLFLHGCLTSRNFTGTMFIENSGFMEVAEANGIIMLFPQNNPLVARGGSSQGCWDTYGAGGEFYATQKGHQLQTLRRMIDAVLGVPYDNHGIDAYSGYDNERPYRLDNADRRPYRVRPASRRNQVRLNGVVTGSVNNVIANGFVPMGNGAGARNTGGGVVGGFGGTGPIANNFATGAAGVTGNGFGNGGLSGTGFGETVSTVEGPITNGFGPSAPAGFSSLVDSRGINGGAGRGNNEIIIGKPARSGNGGRNNVGGVVAYSSVADGNVGLGGDALEFGNIEDDVPLVFRNGGQSESMNTYANVGK